MIRRTLVSFWIALLGCSRARVIAHLEVAPVAPVVPDRCTGFEAKAHADVAKAMQGETTTYPLSSLIGTCLPTAHGSWRIDMPSAPSDPPQARYDLEARFTIVHTSDDGARATFTPADRLSNYGARIPQPPITFDFDGDGESELYVEVREAGDEGHRGLQSDLVTFKNGKVSVYGPASGFLIEALEDVDHDGRPDLKILAHYTAPLLSCGAMFPTDWPEPKWIAHARADGTFSTSDDAAKAWTKTWCPSAPTAVRNSYDAVCAHLWARSPDEVTRARALVVASCTAWSCDLENAGNKQPTSAAHDCERRVAWFDKPPPLFLP